MNGGDWARVGTAWLDWQLGGDTQAALVPIRQEFAENDEADIHVCTVLPMAMETPFFAHAANYTGHEATPIPPVYDPQVAVDAILREHPSVGAYNQTI